MRVLLETSVRTAAAASATLQTPECTAAMDAHRAMTAYSGASQQRHARCALRRLT
jgi:hypothetical protein